MAAKDVLAKALALPTKQRARIARELIVSLDGRAPEKPAELDRAWVAEIRRRIADIDSGRAKLIPWHEAERQIEAALARARRPRKSRKRRR